MQDPYTLLLALAVLLNAALAVLVLQRDPDSPINRSYTFVIGLLVFIGLFYTLQTVTADPHEARVYSRLAAAGGTLLPAFLFRFIIAYLRLRDSRLHDTLSSVIQLLGAVLAGLALGSDLVTRSVYHSTWGWEHVPGPLFGAVFAPFFVGTLLLALALVLLDLQRPTPRADPRDTAFIVAGTIIPCVAGLYSDIIVPLAGYHTVRLGIIATGANVLLMGFAILRRGVFSGSVIAAAGRVSEILGDALFIARSDLAITYSNPAARALLGSDPASAAVALPDLFEESDQIREALENPVSNARIQLEAWIRTDRGRVPVALTASVQKSVHNERSESVILLRDLSEHKAALDAIRESERRLVAEKERLSVTLASIGDGVIATDAQGAVVLLNPVAAHLTGWTEPEASGKHLSVVYRVLSESTGERCEDPLDRALAVDTTFGGTTMTHDDTMLLEARDGSRRLISDSGAPIVDPEHRMIGVVIVFRDLTEQNRQAEELRKAQKLESLGVLAGGIAHDFNNILTAILGNISLMQDTLEEAHPLQRRLTAAEKALQRAKDLTQQLLTFARGGAPVRKTSTIGDGIRESVAFALSGSKTGFRFDLPHTLWPVDADLGQLSQVVQNLSLNASQAMPNGGLVEIRAANVTVGPSPQHAMPAGQYVRIEVQDHGVGIADENLPRIFDPYFTTKPKGSGLGLSVCYSIVKNHGGAIFVESVVGHGTTFFIYLPVSRQSPSTTVEPTLSPVSGHGSVLLMDDEPEILEIAQAILSHLGYTVTTAADGRAATRLFFEARAQGRPFDAVIMDLTVPGSMGGVETVKALMEIDPAVRAIVSSGYSNDPVMSDPAAWGFCAVVGKPYRVEELSRVLHEVISKGSRN